jgi:hypothetical protein
LITNTTMKIRSHFLRKSLSVRSNPQVRALHCRLPQWGSFNDPQRSDKADQYRNESHQFREHIRREF